MKVPFLVERDGDTVRLLAPDVGLFTQAPAQGTALAPGQIAGRLRRLGDDVELEVPAGVTGIVCAPPPERVLEPVDYGRLLVELSPLEGAELEAAEGEDSATGPVLRAAGSGRFYLRPAPDEPHFVSPGDVVEEGRVVGLIEVMKTFTHVTYAAEGGLPARGRVTRVLVEDGDDIAAGDPLLEVEPA